MDTVTLLQPFRVPAGREDEFLESWDEAAEFLRRRAGFVGARLERAISRGEPSRFVAVTEWRTVRDFLSAAVAAEAHHVAYRFSQDAPVLHTEIRSVA